MTIPAATRLLQSSVLAPELYLAFELGQARWKLGFTPGLGQRPRERTIPARDLARRRRRFTSMLAESTTWLAIP